MGKRHDAIGIKQIIALDWMQKAADLLLAGLDAKTIRQELHAFLTESKSTKAEDESSKQTRAFAVNNLMRIWISPDAELAAFRDASLALLRQQPAMALPIHWGMISAAYPFWLNVARQAGRLLALQDQITQSQIVNRLKEHYGDRQTVSRSARFVIRSFIAWGTLRDAGAKGCYERADRLHITDPETIILLFESALLATPDAKSTLGLLSNNPAFFPFQLSSMTGGQIAQHSDRVDVVRYGLDEELLQLTEKHTSSKPLMSSSGVGGQPGISRSTGMSRSTGP
jgi:hypothetical protein